MPPPADEQLTFPRMEQTPRKRGAKNPYAKSWQNDERQFADRLIATWSEAFKKHGGHANRVRSNRTVAVTLYRWLHGKDNDAPKMTEGDVCKAILAYSEDPWNLNRCNGQFLSFKNWITECPDNVDKQLARIREKRGAGQAGKAKDPKAEAAGKLLEFAGLGQLARRATEDEQSLVEHIKAWATRRIPDPPVTGGRDRHQTERDWRAHAIPIVRAFVKRTKEDRSQLRTRASNGASAYLGRNLTRSLADTNIVTAIAVALANRERGAA